MLTSWLLKADALRRLGPRNVANVAAYRVGLRLGIHPVQRLRRTVDGRAFFRMPARCGGVPRPPRHWDLIEPGPTGLDAYRPRLRYLLVDESAYADAELATMRNLAAALFRQENSRGPETVREVLAALTTWLADPAQCELRRSLLLWLREGFLRTRLPEVAFPELNDLEEIRIMLTERVLDWTRQWKQEGWQEGWQEGLQQGLHSERRALLRLIRHRFGETAAAQSIPLLERIAQPPVLEDLFEILLDCPDAGAWLARLHAAVGEDQG